MCTTDAPYINDGECDSSNNNKERCYDGGDCCKENVKCIPGDGTCDCIDPDFKPINCPTNTDPTLPTHDEFFGDSYCDGYLNTKENCFDGGDCCGKEVNTDYCYPEEGDNRECIDPDFKP